jgi:hypothetical protein
MKKYLFILLLLPIALISCDKTVSYEAINMDYNELESQILSADEQVIQVGVSSTHSFRLHCDSSFVSFDYNGLVNYDRSGLAMVRTVHNVYIKANETDTSRIFFVQVTNKYNSSISSSLMFKQLAKEKQDEIPAQ